jgi:opacity protein-like surface antigen
MTLRKLLLGLLVAGLTLIATPRQASADWLFTPFIGGNFGGDADFGRFDDFEDEFERRVDFGGSLGWMGSGIVGFEVDFGWSPNYFENTVGPANFEFGDNYVATAMANVLVGIPVGGQTGGGIRPYASGGLGLIRTHLADDTASNDLTANNLGFDLGAGVHGFFSDNLGIRGDVRYLRSFEDDSTDGLMLQDFDFWRATIGLTIRFGAD